MSICSPNPNLTVIQSGLLRRQLLAVAVHSQPQPVPRHHRKFNFRFRNWKGTKTETTNLTDRNRQTASRAEFPLKRWKFVSQSKGAPRGIFGECELSQSVKWVSITKLGLSGQDLSKWIGLGIWALAHYRRVAIFTFIWKIGRNNFFLISFHKFIQGYNLQMYLPSISILKQLMRHMSYFINS